MAGAAINSGLEIGNTVSLTLILPQTMIIFLMGYSLGCGPFYILIAYLPLLCGFGCLEQRGARIEEELVIKQNLEWPTFVSIGSLPAGSHSLNLILKVDKGHDVLFDNFRAYTSEVLD